MNGSSESKEDFRKKRVREKTSSKMVLGKKEREKEKRMKKKNLGLLAHDSRCCLSFLFHAIMRERGTQGESERRKRGGSFVRWASSFFSFSSTTLTHSHPNAAAITVVAVFWLLSVL